MIIEGIITTTNESGGLHVSPIGPHVDPELKSWTLKPFQTSTTFANLRKHPFAVFHVVDSALLMAESVLGRANSEPAKRIKDQFYVLENCCHWYALEITHWDITEPRAIAQAQVVRFEIARPFWGWNRAKHAVLEAAILASRKHMMNTAELASELERLSVWVDKTAGPTEHEAFTLLKNYSLEP